METIVCKDIVKKFGDFTALDSVSVSIPEGTIFGLLGPNGAGKTTLIRIMNQITIPDSGEVIFRGSKIRPSDISHIGYLPEERGLYKKMKVGEQALYLARLKGLNRAEATAELKKWFVKFGIEKWWNKKVEELSKGMAQKIQFITTVLHRPALLILDEPFSGFDPLNVQLIRNEIIRMKEEGTTIILSTHNMESVEEMCDSIALINKSRLVVTGPVDTIRKEHGDNKIELIYDAEAPAAISGTALLGVDLDEEYKGSRRAVISVQPGVSSRDILHDILNHVENVVSYRELIPSMNDIFIKLVGGK